MGRVQGTRGVRGERGGVERSVRLAREAAGGGSSRGVSEDGGEGEYIRVWKLLVRSVPLGVVICVRIRGGRGWVEEEVVFWGGRDRGEATVKGMAARDHRARWVRRGEYIVG